MNRMDGNYNTQPNKLTRQKQPQKLNMRLILINTLPVYVCLPNVVLFTTTRPCQP